MDIIDKLKKGKKAESVFDAIIKKKKTKEEEEKKEEAQTTPSDLDIRELSTEKTPTEKTEVTETREAQISQFQAGGMYEFDIESLGASADANIKAEYKSKISKLIDENKVDEAIRLLLELKSKLADKGKSR